MDKISKLTELFRRLAGEKPDFFKGLSRWAWILTALSILGLVLDIAGVYALPENIDTLLVLLAGLFGGAAGTAEATVKNKRAAGVPLDDNDDEDGPGPGGEPVKPPTKP